MIDSSGYGIFYGKIVIVIVWNTLEWYTEDCVFVVMN